MYQVLSRAGSEHINSVYFFSKDEPILTLELETLAKDEENVKKGQKLFSSILNTLKVDTDQE